MQDDKAPAETTLTPLGHETEIPAERAHEFLKSLVAVGGGGWAMGSVGSKSELATGYAESYGAYPVLVCRQTLTMVPEGARVDSARWYRVVR